jgi:hypothetical protein
MGGMGGSFVFIIIVPTHPQKKRKLGGIAFLRYLYRIGRERRAKLHINFEERIMAEDHTVEYKSIDYYSMCQKSKDKIKAMQDAGFSTPYDAKSTPEETEMPKMGGYSVIMMGK